MIDTRKDIFLINKLLLAVASAAVLASCTGTSLRDEDGVTVSTSSYLSDSFAPTVAFCTAHEATGSARTDILTAAGFVKGDGPVMTKTLQATDGTQPKTTVTFDGDCAVVISGVALRISQLAPAYLMAMQAQGYDLVPGGQSEILTFSNGATTLNTTIMEFTRARPSGFLVQFRRG